MGKHEILALAQEVFEIEAQAVKQLANQIDSDFVATVEAVLKSTGKFIICGMGKSGHIGKKIAATLASTGTPSFFLHPGEAFHGDLGMVTPNDTVLLISNSGKTDEVLNLIPFFKDNGNLLIGMTGKPDSILAKNVHHHLNVAVEKEACALALAPTSSTTATLAMGDALAVALMKKRQFEAKDFARFHPGGSLGRMLLTNVETLMRKENLPIVAPDTSSLMVVQRVSEGRLGLAIVIENGQVEGIITDGDIRRNMESHEADFFTMSAKDLMSVHPKTINKTAKLGEADQLMNQHKINSLLVTEDEQLLGVIQIYDLNL
ncbi:KpsF/GutQ family sugar-phosphate isomerase [Persicobacter psychrovividus]|uniref:Arabinose-5-phosphate isomerase n=1 Tax=Persicobacter psychrovividus TaxID=387638 RepID=A0ABM7VBN3_9BACT|nr:arabinose-5-phosphate isomerase [Persicobacter psychrovividus]